MDLVRALADGGRMPPRNAMAFFLSAPAVVDLMLEVAELPDAGACGHRFLEPHGGQGAIADRILANPPFRLLGAARAYQAHISHAWSLLAEGGVKVCVAPAVGRNPGRHECEI